MTLLFSKKRGAKVCTAKKSQWKARTLRLESLESRELLAADPTIVVPTTADADNVIVVNSLEDNLTVDEFTTLREAINQAEGGDTITFDSSLAGGKITLSLGVLEIVKPLTIDASDIYNWKTGTPGITIDANSHSSVMFVANAWEGDVMYTVLKGLELTNGNNTLDAGIFLNPDCEMTIVNTTISENVATAGYGGGVFVGAGATFTAINSKIVNNTVNSSAYSNDVAYGGGVFVEDEATFTAINTEISGNTCNGCNGSGGGVYVCAGYGRVAGFTSINSKIVNNSVHSEEASRAEDWIYNGYSSGGGVCVSGTFTSTNTEISGNTLSGRDCSGGGVFVGGTYTSTNTTISGNYISGQEFNCGGGVYGGRYCEGINFYNSIIAGNSSVTGKDEIYSDGATVTAQNSLSSYDLTSYGSGNVAPDEIGSIEDLFNAPNEHDYSLKEGSVALDKGNNEYVTT